MFLEGRIAAGSRHPDRDRAELSALRWALEEIGRFDMVEQAVKTDELQSAVSKLAAVCAIVNARHEPSEADIKRTRQLNRIYGWEPERADATRTEG